MNGKATLKMHNKTFECIFTTDGTHISSLAAVCIELPNFKVDMIMAEEFKAALLGKRSNAVVLEKRMEQPLGQADPGKPGTYVLETTSFEHVPDEKLADQGLVKNDKGFFPGISEFEA
ncbi:MAG: hypothetical protein OHK006_22130 [Thermodesulfovibrionales bacterium]